jgi:hypothetical protein
MTLQDLPDFGKESIFELILFLFYHWLPVSGPSCCIWQFSWLLPCLIPTAMLNATCSSLDSLLVLLL